MSHLYDLVVIGGGINGVGIARDAAGRGLSVYLCDQGDLGGATSSASSKMIHGGLRYLEYNEFGLVREALKEREVLLKAAPHIIKSMDFVIPHRHDGRRPAWLVRLGLLFYDIIGGRISLPRSRGLDLQTGNYAAPLKSDIVKGFRYSDASVDDSRLVILNAIDARAHGASINPHTKFIRAKRYLSEWVITMQRGDEEFELRSRSLVNAAGPWLDQIVQDIEGLSNNGGRIRRVKGSHIIVKKLYDGDHAYLLQNDDKRVVFIWPFQGEYSLIGTTDVELRGDVITPPAISDEEINYLCQSVNAYFDHHIAPNDVVHHYSGVRSLFDDEAGNAAAITRDYRIHLSQHAPNYMSIFGGKITTYRRLAEEAIDKLCPVLDHNSKSWTHDAVLPGGDLGGQKHDNFIETMQIKYDFIPGALIARLAAAYGTRIDLLLNGVTSLDDMGDDLGGGLHTIEIDYLITHEWAQTPDDILMRRSKLGLHVGDDTVMALQNYLKDKINAR